MSPVQQQLSEVNNRYSLLGVKLSDRQNELDSVREEVRKHLDSLKNLSLFLDKVLFFLHLCIFSVFHVINYFIYTI